METNVFCSKLLGTFWKVAKSGKNCQKFPTPGTISNKEQNCTVPGVVLKPATGANTTWREIQSLLSTIMSITDSWHTWLVTCVINVYETLMNYCFLQTLDGAGDGLCDDGNVVVGRITVISHFKDR